MAQNDPRFEVLEHTVAIRTSYMKIFEANRDRLDSRDKIQAGQQLIIPE